MGLAGRRTLIAKCPSCQATTKVEVHPAKTTIRCPRCKVSVPLAFAREYSPKANEEPAEPFKERLKTETVSFDYQSESPIEPPPRANHSNRKKKTTSTSGSSYQQVSYPDHSAGIVKYATLGGAILVIALITGIAYLLWSSMKHEKGQEYISNLTESIGLNKQAIEQIRKALDPLESAEATTKYKDFKGRIAHLSARRRHLTVPEPGSHEGQAALETELATVEKDLATAEEDVKRMINSASAQPLKKVDTTVSDQLGASTTFGPPLRAEKSPPPEPKRQADNTSVIVYMPGVTKEQWSPELQKRFSMLADNGEGQVTTYWAGDLLSVEVRPVLDPARYATKINFARLMYYSRNERIITIEFKPEQANLAKLRDGDSITSLLLDMKQREKTPVIQTALDKLGKMKIDPSRQAEVAAVLETVASDSKLDSTLRESAIKLIASWAGRESTSLLVRLLDDKSASVKLNALDALVEVRAVSAAPNIAQLWERMDVDRVTRSLIALGNEVEPVVLPYLNNNNSVVIRSEACKVLQEVGTITSLKPLLDLINAKDMSPVIVDSAKEAMKKILDRKPQ